MKKQKKEYCGVKFEFTKPLTESQETTIRVLAKANKFKNVLMPKDEKAFIVVFENRVDRQGFLTAITLNLFEELNFSCVNSIKMGD